MKNKKSQGLSLQTIIIAVIVIVVLVVIIFIFTGQLGKFGTSIEACHTRGGRCCGKDLGDCTNDNKQCPDGYVKSTVSCKVNDKPTACCVPIIEK